MSKELTKFASENADSLVGALVKAASACGSELSNEDAAKLISIGMVEMEKVAGMEGFGKSLLGAAGGGAGKAAAGAIAGMGFIAGMNMMRGVSNTGLRKDFEKALDYVIKTSPVIKEAPLEKVKRFAETIHRFAPNVSTDVNLLSSTLGNAIHGEVLDPSTVKSLVELEERMRRYSEVKPKDFALM